MYCPTPPFVVDDGLCKSATKESRQCIGCRCTARRLGRIGTHGTGTVQLCTQPVVYDEWGLYARRILLHSPLSTTNGVCTRVGSCHSSPFVPDNGLFTGPLVTGLHSPQNISHTPVI